VREEDWTNALRYDYIVETTLPLMATWLPTSEAVGQIVTTLLDKNIVLRASAPAFEETEAGTPRLGLTLLVEGRPPLIWINMARHRLHSDPDTELGDTLIHEAIHASAATLGRHVSLPDDTASLAYHVEELCAYSGTSLAQRALGLPRARKNRNIARILEAKLSKANRANVRKQAEAAADWLLETSALIAVNPPLPTMNEPAVPTV
jgi:hypothetical protein